MFKNFFIKVDNLHIYKIFIDMLKKFYKFRKLVLMKYDFFNFLIEQFYRFIFYFFRKLYSKTLSFLIIVICINCRYKFIKNIQNDM